MKVEIRREGQVMKASGQYGKCNQISLVQFLSNQLEKFGRKVHKSSGGQRIRRLWHRLWLEGHAGIIPGTPSMR
jgi:hypothetical protein